MKTKYIIPTMRVVTIQQRISLLSGSGGPTATFMSNPTIGSASSSARAYYDEEDDDIE